MSESKLFKSIVLTLVMYGLISLLQWKKFIVPLPIFEMVVLGICFYFAYFEWKKHKAISGLFVLFGISQFIGRSYNLAFFFSDETLEDIVASPFIDVVLLLSSLLLASLLVFQRIRNKEKLVLTIGLAVALVTTSLLSFTWIVLIPLALICLSFIRQKSLLEKRHSIWAYLLIFGLSRELTLHLL